jgi:S1-C subfamily serine protease
VLVGVDNTRVRSTSELQEYVGRFRPGETVQVDYWRDNRRLRSRIVLKDVNNSTKIARASGNEMEAELGLALRSLSREEQRKLRLQGVMVSSVRRGSVVFQTNMQPGFVITGINGKRVSNVTDAIEAMQSAYINLTLDGYYEGESDLYSYRFKKGG